VRSIVLFAAVLAIGSSGVGCGAVRRVASIATGKKVKTVQLKVGTATITDARSGTSHVRVECNNGLVINADWKRNGANEFGYDIYEPSVNQDTNRLVVMMTARGVIAAYLRGEYG